MKAPFFLLLALGLALAARAQTPGVTYTAAQLDQLVAPIALYPDPLVALILPAATVPTDITLAANYLAVTGDPAGIDAQPWDPSVKGLARYPDVVKWMNDNLAWTETLGAAFLQQPTDIMKSIQQLRAEALAAGTLVNTLQQQVDVEGDDIRIIPTQDNTIYVPTYDPSLVYYAQPGYLGPFLTFGPGYPVGAWLSYQCDWDSFGIWVGPWERGWAYNREWRRPGNPAWRSWQPDPRRSYEVVHNAYRPESRLPGPGTVTQAREPARESPLGGAIGIAPAPELPHATLERPRPVFAAPAPAPDYRGRGTVTAAPAPALGGVAGGGRAPGSVTPAPARPAPSSPVFGGYSRGTDARDFSSRGQESRAAPVREAPSHSAPARASAPAAGGEYKDRH
jgi:hypothetical protein